MIVVIQSKNGVIDTSKITKVTTNKEGGIYATCENNTRETLAFYDNLKVAKFALGMYASALADDEHIFYFPNNEEVKSKMTLKRNNVSKTVANSHGGS